jgi:dihydrofolate reductase
VPIFVLTHRAPEPVAKGENGTFKFHFVAEDIRAVVARAKAVAGERNITVVGSAQTIRECIKTGLLDEIEIGIMPVLLGESLRLFETLGIEPLDLEKIKVVETGPRTDIVFRVSRG